MDWDYKQASNSGYENLDQFYVYNFNQKADIRNYQEKSNIRRKKSGRPNELQESNNYLEFLDKLNLERKEPSTLKKKSMIQKITESRNKISKSPLPNCANYLPKIMTSLKEYKKSISNKKIIKHQSKVRRYSSSVNNSFALPSIIRNKYVNEFYKYQLEENSDSADENDILKYTTSKYISDSLRLDYRAYYIGHSKFDRSVDQTPIIYNESPTSYKRKKFVYKSYDNNYNLYRIHSVQKLQNKKYHNIRENENLSELMQDSARYNENKDKIIENKISYSKNKNNETNFIQKNKESVKTIGPKKEELLNINEVINESNTDKNDQFSEMKNNEIIEPYNDQHILKETDDDYIELKNYKSTQLNIKNEVDDLKNNNLSVQKIENSISYHINVEKTEEYNYNENDFDNDDYSDKNE